MSSLARARSSFFGGPNSGVLVDIALAIALFLGSLVLLLRSGFQPASLGAAELNLLCVVLAGSSTIPLSVWRRFPLGVFVITGTASVALAGIGYLMELPLGFNVALYLLTASRKRDTPWTGQHTVCSEGMVARYLEAG